MMESSKMMADVLAHFEEIYRQKFPEDLKSYLIDKHDGPWWPYDAVFETVFYGVQEDIDSYMNNNLEIRIRTTEERLKDLLYEARSLYCEAMRDNELQAEYISELHQILSRNNLSSSKFDPGVYEPFEFKPDDDYELPFQ